VSSSSEAAGGSREAKKDPIFLRSEREKEGNFICEQFLYLREIRLLPTTSCLSLMEPRLIDTASHGNAVPPRINTTISMAS